MECAGIRVDPDRLRHLSHDFSMRMADMRPRPSALAGRPFNLGSPKQIGDVLFGDMALAGGKKTATGVWSTDASVLEDLAAQGHALPRVLLDWRQLSKLKGTYTDALAQAVSDRTGRVHTSFALAVDHHGPAFVIRSQPAEHSDPHRGRPQDPRRLRRRAGSSLDQR